MQRKFSFAITTFGCQMNKSRSEHLAYLLSSHGFIPSSQKEEADILIFNTCAVREHAVERAIHHIHQTVEQLSLQRATSPIVVVCGCMSELLREKLSRKLPFVTILVGTSGWDKLPSLIQETLVERETSCFFPQEDSAPFLESGYLHGDKISAYLPITYGCDNFCSYCVVPYVTGRQRSKPMDLILQEFQNILAQGFREIILLGQNVNSYGRDFGEERAFEKLLETLEQRFGEQKIWVRFITSHPKDMRKSIIGMVRESSIFCAYFHLPLQAGSDKILALMNRKYTQREYLHLVALIRETFPEGGIGTDIIVGFPGETEDDFQETLHVVRKAQFDIAYTYVYSPRPHTRAATLVDDVPLKVKKERLSLLNSVLREVYLERVRCRLHTETTVLLDEEDDSFFHGHTASNLRVYIRKREGYQIGAFVPVKLRALQGTKVEGEIVGVRYEDSQTALSCRSDGKR